MAKYYLYCHMSTRDVCWTGNIAAVPEYFYCPKCKQQVSPQQAKMGKEDTKYPHYSSDAHGHLKKH